MPELCRAGASKLSRMLAAVDVSSVEVVEAHLGQIERTNPTHNAIVTMRASDKILTEAKAADAARAAGAIAAPLAGLPIAIKDLQPTRGLKTTFGSPLFADFVPDADSLTVERLRAAGAIVIGKTNTPEFGLGSNTYNTVFGRTLNAFDPSLTAGGSSGGAAVAVALGMLPIADGSDFGGSLRNPGAYNNVFGFRPSLGRVPNVPAKDAFYGSFSTDGPIARSVEDLALTLSVMAGYDPRTALASADEGFRYEDRLGGAEALKPKVAWLGSLYGRLPFEPGVLEICEAALAAMEPAGWRAEAAAPDFDFEALWRSFVTLRGLAALTSHGAYRASPEQYAQLKPEMRWEIETAARLSADDIAAAMTTRTRWRETALGLLERFDAIALPTAQVFPFPVDWDWPKEISGVPMDSYHRWMEVVAPGSMTGFPVVNLPAGFAADGRPMGFQLIGRPHGDLDLLRIAAAYEAAAPRA
ncbi:amidase [Chenggangzhangella methanolivorans]|uniref:Indoleacetamide hydrolase n=2 Tax=Chenggangzhangella methanolivorans TaxID=1437009 RepID=A0A9E6UQ58_9HYPH|nr:amidase [Chenggangzhangella methanolivorans]